MKPRLTQTLCETLSFLFLKNLFSLKRFVQLLFLQNLLLLKHFVKRSVSSSFKTYSHSNTLCNDHFPLPSKPTLTQTLCETLSFLFLQKPTLTQTLYVMLSFLFLQNLFSLKHFVQHSVSSSSKTYFHSNALWNTQFSLPPKPILTPSQTLCQTLTASSFKTYSHSNILWNAHFPLPSNPTLTQTLCETLTFLFLQILLSLKHFVKHSPSSCSKTYSHSNTLWNTHFPLPSKPTLTQTLWETLTFLLLQNLIEV